MKLRTASILASFALATGAGAQSTAFTYQGRLKNGAQVAAGLHDFRFRLWDGASGGTQVGSTQCVDNLLVSEGVFTATIDFGQQFVLPSARFLEIEVRADTGLTCASAAGFVVLAPRQLLTAAPLASNANHANAAFSLDAADGSPANAVFVDNNGNVGIGTTTPGHSVTIANDAPTIALQDTGLSSQQVGYISYRDGGNVERAWVGYGSAGDPDFSIVNVRTGGDIVLSPFGGSGRVGIGTASPAATLDVRGDIRLGPSGQFRAASGEENLRIVRGTVGFVGAIVSGQGFTVTYLGNADYLITFNTPFASAPTVTATVDDQADEIILYHYWVAGVYAAGPNSVRVRTRGHSSSTFPTGRDPKQFHFIAAGPR